METCLIGDEGMRLEVVPALGAGIVRFEVNVAGTWWSLLRPARLDAATGALDLACVLMIPWTNRIFGGGFDHGGRRVELAANLPASPVPLHGNALTSAWEVSAQSAGRIEMELRSRGPGPFDYGATVAYELEEGLRIDVSVRHEGAGALPYGLGIHPWFVHTPQATLRASAQRACLVDAELRPTRYVAIAEVPQWDFSVARKLPDALIDNSFTGWDGYAELLLPELGVNGIKLKIEASPRLGRIFQIYSPARESGFVCFEPVSHLVNEHNEAANPTERGLVVLERGEKLEGSMQINIVA